ncbi:toll/interleukin-1 receptor domain-containing protein [Micromonospora sp. CPCC 206171]|uniref:toll/interleukin-1 receptor domain-containing protein n=1 Tax=Micromonospora sp. CPCC 206171 TaxID=3122405 RepID=UPI002FEFECC7
MTAPSDRLNVKVFLSHRYRSPAVNLQFFDLIDQVADVQFEVDRGLKATSTTRLERMIRDVEIFAGIYSLSDDPFERLPAADLVRATRYFKLELDMAMRYRKPSILFIDRRFGNRLHGPPGSVSLRYSAQEILSQGMETTRRHLRDEFATFCRSIANHSQKRSARDTAAVGLLVPPTGEARGAIAAAVEAFNYAVEVLPWPIAIDGGFIAQLQRCDWVLADLSQPSAVAAVAFLRGHGIPVLRIGPVDGPPDVATEELIYGELAPHYAKDLIRWSDPERLQVALEERIGQILSEPGLIDNRVDAQGYFQSAAKLNHLVFLSYAKEDHEYADRIGAELSSAFQEVFDYRKPAAIPHGARWLDHMLASLATAAIGVPLLSPNYVASSYCMEEGRRMMDAALGGRMRVFPVLLADSGVDLFSQLEYRRATRMSPTEIVAGIAREVA